MSWQLAISCLMHWLCYILKLQRRQHLARPAGPLVSRFWAAVAPVGQAGLRASQDSAVEPHSAAVWQLVTCLGRVNLTVVCYTSCTAPVNATADGFQACAKLHKPSAITQTIHRSNCCGVGYRQLLHACGCIMAKGDCQQSPWHPHVIWV